MKYRREIDGLRAVALMPVMLFHAGFQSFSGGFVGVDVFFVISGYLITSIILAEKQAGTFTLINFSGRRARRILPALFVVMFACLPFAWLWLLPADMIDFSQSLIAVAVFVSNILFWTESGYFETAGELKPLLHTWSLAVEEQYYILFPIFILLAWKLGKRWVLAMLAVLAAFSLALAQWTATTHRSFAFYLLPTRGWEILTGVFIAFYLSPKESRWEKAQPSNQALGIIGLSLILASVFIFDKETPFPSLYALMPTIGAALVIVFASDRTIVGRLLGSKAFVGIGLISYSAYLWHQPMFAFARHRSINEPDKITLMVLAILALVFAYLTWKFVEAPFRNRRLFNRSQIFLYGILASVAFIAIGLAGILNKGYLMRWSYFPQISTIQTVMSSRCHTYLRKTAEQIAKGDICVLGKASVASFAVIGDSHAGALFEAIEAYESSNPFAFYAFSGEYCAPLLGGFRLNAYQSDDCLQTTSEAYKKIFESKSIKDVVLVAEWANYTEGYRDGKKPALASDDYGSAAVPAENKVIFSRTLAYTVDAIKSAGKNVIIIKPTPEFKADVTRTATKQMINDIIHSSPTVTFEEYLTRNKNVFQSFESLRDVTFVDSASVFCSADLCRSVGNDGKILFSDTNHVTGYGARFVVDQLMNKLHWKLAD